MWPRRRRLSLLTRLTFHPDPSVDVPDAGSFPGRFAVGPSGDANAAGTASGNGTGNVAGEGTSKIGGNSSVSGLGNEDGSGTGTKTASGVAGAAAVRIFFRNGNAAGHGRATYGSRGKRSLARNLDFRRKPQSRRSQCGCNHGWKLAPRLRHYDYFRREQWRSESRRGRVCPK